MRAAIILVPACMLTVLLASTAQASAPQPGGPLGNCPVGIQTPCTLADCTTGQVCQIQQDVCTFIQSLGIPNDVTQYAKEAVGAGNVWVAEYTGGPLGDSWLVQGICSYLSLPPPVDCTQNAINNGGNPLDCFTNR